MISVFLRFFLWWCWCCLQNDTEFHLNKWNVRCTKQYLFTQFFFSYLAPANISPFHSLCYVCIFILVKQRFYNSLCLSYFRTLKIYFANFIRKLWFVLPRQKKNEQNALAGPCSMRKCSKKKDANMKFSKLEKKNRFCAIPRFSNRLEINKLSF